MHSIEEYGFVGNVWVRQNFLEKKGDITGGHLHHHDHVSLLVSGSVEITVHPEEPKIFSAPTFIVIKKEHRHVIKALEDNTVFYCIYAMRDVYGEVVDIYQDWNVPNLPEGKTPNYTHVVSPEFWGEPQSEQQGK